mmetsp:Transcript_64184/g.126840  ORF Transcript_64184/g.126840 Transcript_64184/m.126840 type:complete len:228 (+) Transcript_64184:197-880(+)
MSTPLHPSATSVVVSRATRLSAASIWDALELVLLLLGLLLRLVLALVVSRLVGGLVLLIPRLLLLLLALGGRSPQLLALRLSVLNIIRHQDVVEDGAVVDNPQLEPKLARVVRRKLHALLVVLVGDLRGLPLALVVGVGNLGRDPLTLEIWVVDQRGLPLAIVLIVPVLRLGGVGVGDLSGNVIIAVGLLGLRVVHLGLVNPVGGLGVSRVVNSRLREVPILKQRTL